MILTRDKGSRMWGGGGTGGSGGGGGLDPSALAGYASIGFVEDNYVSKAFFNQLFEYQYNQRVLTKDGETVVSDVTTAMVAAPNDVVDLVSHTETDEETGYTIITTNTITGIKAKAGLWTNQYMSALGQNSSGGGGGATLFEPLLSINESGLAAPTDAQDGMTVVWDKNTHKWKYGATGGGSGDYFRKIANENRNINFEDNNNKNGVIYINRDSDGGETTGFFGTYGSVLNISNSAANWQIGVGSNDVLKYRSRWWSNNPEGSDWTEWKEFAFVTSNVASATKLQTARTLWGQSFDGTANVSGNMTGVGTISANGNNVITKTTGEDAAFVAKNSNGSISLLTSTNRGVYDNSVSDWLIYTNGTNTMLTKGNVGIGTTTPGYKLEVNGTLKATKFYLSSSIYFELDGNNHVHLVGAGLYSDSFISALGLNSSGGGGGGSSTVTSVAAGTGLTTNITGGGAITSTGTISLSSATQTDIAKGVTAYGWGNHALAGYAQNSALNNYLPLAGGTMQGVITLGHSTTEGSSYSSAISVAIRTSSGTRADTYTYGNWIHGGEDHADQDGANIQIGTWFGFGIYPTISGMTRTQGKNSFWHNARTGNTYTWGNFYCYDGTNNNKVATENWVNGAYLPLAGGTMTGTLRLLTGSSVGIEASDNAGLFVYKPESGWSGVSNTQWAVGALSAQGVIRSNDNSLLHYNGTNNYKIWDEDNDGSGSGLDADLLDGIHAKDMLIHYQLPRNTTASTYWHKLGEYITGGDNSNLILEVYSGSGYNSTGNKNSWAKIILKDGWQNPNSETGVGPTNSVGVSVEEYGYYSTGIKVIVVATAHNKGAVWVQLPWQYAVGDYVVYGRYTSWTHNNSIESDTTTAPTSNQNPVYYYRNLSYLNMNGQEAVTLQHDFSVKAGVDGAQLRVGNILLKYDATNKALKIEHQGTNGVEAGNIYATGAVSALGANTSGGGGGGGTGTVTSITAGTGLSGGTITTMGTIAINSTYQQYIADGETAYGWGNHAIAGYVTKSWVENQDYLTSVAFSDLTSHPTTIAGYGITDAKFGTVGADYVPITLGSTTKNVLTAHQSLSAYATQTWVTNNFLGLHATADAATKLATARELWGQSFDGTSAVTGTLSYVGDINSNTNGNINNFNGIEMSYKAGSGHGGGIFFHWNGVTGYSSAYIYHDADNHINMFGHMAGFGVQVGSQNGDFLQIGAVRLVYDTSNNALKVIKSDGTAANLYATGGLSALGMSAGVSSIDAMTFGYLKVNDQLVFGNNQALIYKDDYLYIECSDTISVNNVEFDYSGNVYTNGSVRAARFYLDSNRYLYVSSGTLYYYNGTTSKQVAFTN